MSARSPRISVLLPCRDVEHWLPACIRSLERQTEDDFEVLAVDDGSRDGTPELLRAWARRDRRVRIESTTGEGVVAALTRAAGEARGEYLARMDADDVAHRDRLRRQREFLDRNRGVAACGTGVRYVPRGSLGSGFRRYERWLNGLRDPRDLSRDLFVECPVAHPTLMLRRTAFDAVGGYRDPGWPEDYDLVIRLHRAGFRLANVAAVLHLWRRRPQGLTVRSSNYSPAAFLRCKTEYLASSYVPRDRPLVIWGAGRVGKRVARALRERGMRPVGLVDLDPRKIGQEIHGARVYAPASFARAFSRPRAYVLAAVGAPGARQEIRRALRAIGYREEHDYRAVA